MIFLRTLIDRIPRPLRLLDVGGTVGFWEGMGFAGEPGLQIHLLNQWPQEVPANAGFVAHVGDATNMQQFADGEFDVVFSNSVIEHLFQWDNQVRMANEIQRVGRNYYVQTPNYWFPVEPHFVCPLFQYMPQSTRVALITRFSLGHHPRYASRDEAWNAVREVRLLSRRQVRALFPQAEISLERMFGLPKSIIAHQIAG